MKLANRDLTVIAAGGDGDGYAIGAGHFVHAVRRNTDMTYIVMDNQTYGLTKGQSSPTSATGYVASVSPDGNPDTPLNGLALALAAGATFIARGFSAQPKQMVAMIKAAVEHRGFAIVEVMSPCVTYNKINTYAWFKENTEDGTLRDGYAPNDRLAAFEALTTGRQDPAGHPLQRRPPDVRRPHGAARDADRAPRRPHAARGLRRDPGGVPLDARRGERQRAFVAICSVFVSPGRSSVTAVCGATRPTAALEQVAALRADDERVVRVVDRDRLADAEQLAGERGVVRAHRERAVAGAEHGEVGPVARPDERHVAVHVGVARRVHARAADVDDEPGRGETRRGRMDRRNEVRA